MASRFVRNSRDLELVLGVERKIVLHGDAAHGAERQAVEMQPLRVIAGNGVGFRADRDSRIADRERADAVRGREVALEQRRRDDEHVRVVVEAVRGVVGRQQRRHVDVETEQLANRVRVLGAIQAPQRRASRARRQLRVELAFEPRGEALVRLGIGPTLRGRRRHRARAQLAHDGLPHLRMRFDSSRVEIREREAAVEIGRVVAIRAVARRAAAATSSGAMRPHPAASSATESTPATRAMKTSLIDCGRSRTRRHS